jgi:plasmid stabilization system protein ParE
VARTLELHPDALLEAEDAATWYAARSGRAGSAFAAELDHALALVVDAPERWPQYLAGTRRVLLRRFPFHVVYRVEPAMVLVVAVAHGRRRPGYWRDRL